MSFDSFEYKSSSLGSLQAKGGSVNLDEAQGVVECFVAGIGNKDSVGDIVASGAFTKSLQRRKPRVVWGHNWNDPIGKVLEIYEVPNTDPRLPMKMKMAGIGGLFARVQFNLNSEKGREAFANVAFFGEEQEWSIGYKTLRAQFDQKSQANVIFELELYEVSPVLHGANQLTGTISVKSDERPMGTVMLDDEYQRVDREEMEKQLSSLLGTKVSIMDIEDDEVTFARRDRDGQVGRYKCGFNSNRGRFMFGQPEQIVVVAKPKPQAMPGMPPVMPVGSPGIPMVEPQRVVRPMQMPSIPVAIKPGEDGPRMIPLPRVEYDGQDQETFDPNNLDQEEADLRDALLKIVKRHGKFNEDSDGVWAGYKPAVKNPVAGIGVKCANCVFYQGGNSCKIIDMEVEPEGKCRFAVIPKGVVKGDSVSKKTYQLEEEVNEDDYIGDLEVKYPGELVVAAIRGIVGRKRRRRKKYKELSEFGSSSDDLLESKGYVIPVMPQYAFKVKQALDPIFEYHMVDSYVDEDGVVLTSGVTYELIDAVDTALDNLKKKLLDEDGIEEKAAGYRLGRAIGSRLIDRPNIGGGRSRGRFFSSPGAENFDPRTARDVDLDGIVGEGLFVRGVPLAQPDPTPDGPGSIRNPKPSREQLNKPAIEKPNNIAEQPFVEGFASDSKPKKPKYETGPAIEKKPSGDDYALSSGASELLADLPDINDGSISAMRKFTAAEQMREELQGVMDEADEPDQIRRLKRALNELDKYISRAEKMAERSLPRKEKKKAQGPKETAVERSGVKMSSGYAKYLDTPARKRNKADTAKYDGPLSSLSSGKLAENAEIPEGSPVLQDVYDALTEQIVKSLEELANNPNPSQWNLPWRNPERFARNPTKGRIYQGMNQMSLTMTSAARGYELNRWAGITQWRKLGGKLKPNSKDSGVQILVPREGRSYIDSSGREVSLRKAYVVKTVFNVSDIDGLPEEFYKQEDLEQNMEQRIADLETVVSEIGAAVVETKGSQAFYRPSTDKIHMPAFEQFKDALAFYGTLLHENIHWTSHPTRLNRTVGQVFGDEKYAFEELIAEIGAAFAMGTMGLEATVREDHLLYLNSWIKKLRQDPSALERAIRQAQQANDYLMNRSATMRRLAGIPDDERKGPQDAWYEVPMLAGYGDSEKLRQPTTISGPMEDLLDMEEMDVDYFDVPNRSERELEKLDSYKNGPARSTDGTIITMSGRLASGKSAGPIKGKTKNAKDIRRTSEKVSMKWAFGLSTEPTDEQRDIIDTVKELVRTKDAKIVSVLAGAGTGKTTTLKSISRALDREFNLWPVGDVRRKELLAYLSDRYEVDFDGMPDEQIEKTVEELKKKFKVGNLYYAVFNRKNQKEAEREFPDNTGIATTDKLWHWSLMLGQGDEKYGVGMRRKMLTYARKKTDKDKSRPNPNYKSDGSTPNEPERIMPEFTAESYDGKTITVRGVDPGIETLGWARMDDGRDWVKYLDLANRSDVQTRKTQRPARDNKGRKVKDPSDPTGKAWLMETIEEKGVVLPNGDFATIDELGDLLSKAMRRWSLSSEPEVKKWMFTLSDMERQERDSPRGRSKAAKKGVHVVDAALTEDDIPDQWVKDLETVISAIMDGNSNMLPTRDSVAKLWMMTNPDLRTDPGLIAHKMADVRTQVSVDKKAKPGDIIERDGKEWIVAAVYEEKNSPGINKAKLARRMADKNNPLAGFLLDEAQDSNEVLEAVIEANRSNLPIVMVGDDRQGINGFKGAKNIMGSIESDYVGNITESFRFGEVIAYLGNMVLAIQNIYLDKQGVKQEGWKHVKGKARDAIDRLFDRVLPREARLGVRDLPDISDEEREIAIRDIESQFSTLKNKINILGLPRDKQDAAIIALRDEMRGRRRGSIVDRYEELEKSGDLPSMILTRTNPEIINEALKFITEFAASPGAKLKDGILQNPPEIRMPKEKHDDLVKFARHLNWIYANPSTRGQKPEESSWIGPIWDVAGVMRRKDQKLYQQLGTAWRLVMQPSPSDPNKPALGAGGLLTLLVGGVQRDSNGKIINNIAPAIMPSRETVKLGQFNGGQEIEERLSAKNAAWTQQQKDNKLKKIIIIPGQAKTGENGVVAYLEVEGGRNPKLDGKPTGRIIITGDGVDTGRLGADGKPPAHSRKGHGNFRRDTERIIETLGLQAKVSPIDEPVPQQRTKGTTSRPPDGFIIEGANIEESTEILQKIGQALREAAEESGGDVEITTMNLSKGLESRFIAIAEDLRNPDELITPLDRGQAAINYMQELNLLYVAFTRAKEKIDPGAMAFMYLLHDEATQEARAGLKKAVDDGLIPAELDMGAFADGNIALPPFFEKLNKTARQSITPAMLNRQMKPPGDSSGGNNPPGPNSPGPGGSGTPGPDPLTPGGGAINPQDAGDGSGISPIVDGGDDNDDDLGPDSPNDDELDDMDSFGDIGGEDEDNEGVEGDTGMSLSSGAAPRRLNRRAGRSAVTPGQPSAQQIAGIRLDGNPDNPRTRRALEYAMDVWDGLRKRGIALDINSTSTGNERRKEIASAMKNVSQRMSDRNGVRIGKVSDNAGNDSPSASTWMLSAEKLADMIRVPTEFTTRSGDDSGDREVVWTQSRALSMDELGKMLGLKGRDLDAIKEPNAGINHDGVRHLIAEIGREPQFGGWKLFGPLTRDENVSGMSPAEMFSENTGRANMRDRFIIETFGKDAYPHWFDIEENESISPEEYESLGEVSEVAKFRAAGRFYPDSATRGDSEAEIDILENSINELDLNEIEVDVPETDIKADKTSRKDFDLDSLLDYLGIDKKEWQSTMRERLSTAFGIDNVGLTGQSDWRKNGVPVAYINQMIKTGVIPNASAVWKDGDSGEKLDSELKNSKHVVYEALNEFIDKTAPSSRLNSDATRREIVGATDMGTALKAAASSRGSGWSPKKGDEPRFSGRELQSIVDRFNRIFGTNHTVDDIFSAEQIETARKRIEEEGTTTSGKRKRRSQ